MHRDEQGFGLVEVMVAMMIFAVISVATIPLLLNGMKLTAESVATAQAAKIATEQMAIARENATSCTAFLGNANRVVENQIDARGTVFEVTLSSQIQENGELEACSDATHPTQWFSVTVKRSGTGRALIDVRTIVAVPGLR